MDSCGCSLGYGFVLFGSPHDAIKAIEDAKGMILMSKKLYLCKFVPKLLRKPATSLGETFTNVHCKNLTTRYLTDVKLRELFSAYAPTTSIHIPTTVNNTPIGYAFINLLSSEMSERAATEMNNRDIDGQALYVSRAQKRSERTAILREQ